MNDLSRLFEIIVVVIALFTPITSNAESNTNTGYEDPLIYEISNKCTNLTKRCVHSIVKSRLPATIAHVSKRSLKLTGETIITIKALTDYKQKPVAFAIDGSGSKVAQLGEDKLKEEYKARKRARGKMTQPLADKLSSSKKSKKHSVRIWLREPPTVPSKTLTKTGKKPSAATTNKIAKDAKNNFMTAVGSSTSLNISKFTGVAGAPAIAANVNKSTIRTLSRMSSVATIYDHHTDLPTHGACCGCVNDDRHWRSTLRSYSAQDNLGVTGNEQNVCIIEKDYPDSISKLNAVDIWCKKSDTSNKTNCSGPTSDYHPKGSASKVSNTDSATPPGISKDSKVYFANTCCDTNKDGICNEYRDNCDGDGGYWASVINEACVDNGYDIWTRSVGLSNYKARFLDYKATTYPYPLIANSAGNDASEPIGPAIYNGMLVGGTCNVETYDREDDPHHQTTTTTASFRNPCKSNGEDFDVYSEFCPNDDREVPHIATNSHSNRVLDGLSFGGTSAASPEIAGIAALIHEQNSYFDDWPELSRAVIMATANANPDDTILVPHDTSYDDRDGAGLPNAYQAARLASSKYEREPYSTSAKRGWSEGRLDFEDDCKGTGEFCGPSFQVTGAANSTQVIFAWNADASCSDNDRRTSCSELKLTGDLDIAVYKVSDGSYVDSSVSYDNAYEAIRFDGKKGEKYKVRIRKWNTNSDGTYFGIAWAHPTFEVSP